MKINDGIKSVVLVLENCEVVEIPIELIVDIHLSEYKRTFTRSAINSISMVESFDFIYMVINRDVDNSGLTLNFTPEEYQDDITRRLAAANDITAIEVVYEDDSENEDFTVYTPWIGDDYDNENQSITFNTMGDIQIIIATPEAIYAEVELLEELETGFNDSEYMNTMYKLYKLYSSDK